jgi:hypothetical protein
MAAITPIRDDAAQRQDGDGVRWLALLLRVSVISANGLRARYSLSRGEKCPRCGHAF